MLLNYEQSFYNIKYEFKGVKKYDEKIIFCCPAHNDSKPSCNISLTSGLVHCFSCGFSANFEQFVNFCETGDKFSKKLHLSFNRQKLKIIERNLTKSIDNFNLNLYNYKHDYMYKRGLNDELIERYCIGYDENFIHENKIKPCITFPLRDQNGNVKFIARRGIYEKFFHYPKGVEKGIYGIYELDYSKNILIICESFFNTLTCVKFGYNSVALMGTGTKKQLEIIKKLPFKKVLLGFDGDSAGDKGKLFFQKGLTKFKNLGIINLERNKDINDFKSKKDLEENIIWDY